MTSELGQWQERLDERFSELADLRQGTLYRVFALEHGLGPNETENLLSSVRAAIQDHRLNELERDFYLPMVVYAAELGYNYSGYEYWDSFKEQSPGWDHYYRETVPETFDRFSEKYQGAKPDGIWAKHFRLIAWPITHAILPQDLQRRLIELVHRYRHSRLLDPELLDNTEKLGAYIHGLATHGEGSRRFEKFTENKVLIGQITRALLFDERDSRSTDDRILASTVIQRLVEDIRRQIQSRTQFDNVRDEAKRRILTGSRYGRDQTEGKERSGDVVPLGSPWSPEFRVQLMDGSYSLYLQLPNLAHIANRYPELKAALLEKQLRCPAAPTKVIARGRLLREKHPQIRLERWPAPGERLIEFPDASSDEVDKLIRSYQMGNLEKLLFRIYDNGSSRSLKTTVVSPGFKYILLTQKDLGNPASPLEKIEVRCDGAFCILIPVPNPTTETFSTASAIG